MGLDSTDGISYMSFIECVDGCWCLYIHTSEYSFDSYSIHVHIKGKNIV